MHTVSVTQRLLSQLGQGNLLAISGGRVNYNPTNPNMVILPVRSGYSVEIEYNEVPDTYTVRRTFTRGFKRWVKGEAVNIYNDQLGDTAYRASCYSDVWEGGQS